MVPAPGPAGGVKTTVPPAEVIPPRATTATEDEETVKQTVEGPRTIHFHDWLPDRLGRSRLCCYLEERTTAEGSQSAHVFPTGSLRC